MTAPTNAVIRMGREIMILEISSIKYLVIAQVLDTVTMEIKLLSIPDLILYPKLVVNVEMKWNRLRKTLR